MIGHKTNTEGESWFIQKLSLNTSFTYSPDSIVWMLDGTLKFVV